jgi:hypothetical protein
MSAPIPSPLRSTLAVLAGFGLNWFLAGAGAGMLAALFPEHFPPAPADGTPPAPSTLGLVLVTATFSANALLAGVLAGRIASYAPVVHAGILAGVFGLLALWGLDQARGQPGLFALAFVGLPPLFAVLGGLVAQRAAKRRDARTPRIVSERIPPVG